MAARVIHVEACSPDDNVNVSGGLAVINGVSSFQVATCRQFCSFFQGHVVSRLRYYPGLGESDRLIRDQFDIWVVEQ